MKSILVSVALLATMPHAYAVTNEELQEELETLQFEQEMAHDETMDALAGHNRPNYGYAPAPAPRHDKFWFSFDGHAHNCSYDPPNPIAKLLGASCKYRD